MSATVVRYRVAPGYAAANAEMILGVYAELRAVKPEGFRYATYVLDDGVTFVHVAEGAGVLPGLDSFRMFRAGLSERCAEPPHVAPARVIGAY